MASEGTGALDVLTGQERVLVYQGVFDSERALKLGREVVRQGRGYDRGIGVQIVRVRDGLPLFCWMADDKEVRHLEFLERKRIAVMATGHCSLWPAVEHELRGTWEELFSPDARALPAAGAFPIRAESGLVAILSVCGLRDGLDHEIAVRGLCGDLGLSYGTDVPALARSSA